MIKGNIDSQLESYLKEIFQDDDYETKLNNEYKKIYFNLVNHFKKKNFQLDKISSEIYATWDFANKNDFNDISYFLFTCEIIEYLDDFFRNYYETKIIGKDLKDYVDKNLKALSLIKELQKLNLQIINYYSDTFSDLNILLDLESQITICLTNKSMVKMLTIKLDILIKKFLGKRDYKILDEIYQVILPNLEITKENIKDHLRK